MQVVTDQEKRVARAAAPGYQDPMTGFGGSYGDGNEYSTPSTAPGYWDQMAKIGGGLAKNLASAPGYGLSRAFSEPVSAGQAQAPAAIAQATARVAPGGSPTMPRMGGSGFDDPRRLDLDPGRKSLGAMRDMSSELSTVPAQLPPGLQQGVIYKTKGAKGETVYSGMNVGPDAKFVNGRGQEIAARGSVGIAPAAAKPAAGLGAPIGVAGQTYSSVDNATMAANLRDGVDLYRGTSMEPKPSAGQQYAQQMMNAPRALKDLTQRQLGRIQEAAAGLDQRGEQLQQQQARLGMDMQQAGLNRQVAQSQLDAAAPKLGLANMEYQNAQQVNGLRQQLAAAQTPEQRQAITRQLYALGAIKDQEPGKWVGTRIRGADGGESLALVNDKTGEVRGAPTAAQPAAGGVAQPKSSADYQAIPSGAKYLDPRDGVIKTKS
jgi:hypothetical protein